MKFAYHVDPQWRDENGHWWPRLVWADGLVTTSCGRIHATHTLEEARSTVARWNWAHGVSQEDYMAALTACQTRNETLALEDEA